MEATATPTSALAEAARTTTSAWDLLVAITARDIRARYQGTVLSFFWWIARPLAMGVVLYFALGAVLRLDIPNYAVFLMSAIFPWYWFSGAVGGAASSFVSNGGLIRKVRFPRVILPLSSVFFNTVQFVLTLPVLTIFVLVSGQEPTLAWLIGIPILMVLQLALLIGLTTLIASLNVFFRDIGPMVDVTLLLMFYITPIIYPLERVPAKFRPITNANPVAPLIQAWRDLIIYGDLPGFDLWPALLLTAAVFVIGIAVFRRTERYFADAL